jgi:polysaccharide export outer membrane protein
MKLTKIALLAAVVIMFASSCRSYKEITLLRDAGEDGEATYLLPPEPPAYEIKEKDNLYVSILTLDAELNRQYNPSMGQGGFGGSTEQTFGSPTAQYLNGYQVDNNGNIQLPVLGPVNVAGLTLNQAQQVIFEAASEFIKDPTINVKLLSFRFTVLGEVQRPGLYYNFQEQMTIFEAISLANGNTEFAEIDKVLVLRKTDDEVKSIRVNLSSIEMLNSDAYFIYPDDVVYVQPDKFKNVALKAPVYSLILSTITVAVLILNLVNL